ncbi:hypothetical protein GCM10023235_45920 [Kitasatospora terrestris]|uniref:Uncharacterized protein n=1 Tax=Kitasatospora terrestris TaxID=258051 RepID=A0ABP9DZ79_9ACTN
MSGGITKQRPLPCRSARKGRNHEPNNFRGRTGVSVPARSLEYAPERVSRAKARQPRGVQPSNWAVVPRAVVRSVTTAL